MTFDPTEGHWFADGHGKMWRCGQPEGHEGPCTVPVPPHITSEASQDALTAARADGAREALLAAAYHFGVIWGSGATTEVQVAEVLTHWAEHGVGTRLDTVTSSD